MPGIIGQLAAIGRARVEGSSEGDGVVMVLDQIDVAVVARDLEGRTISWNSAAERLYGWTREEAIGRPLSQLIGCGEQPRHDDVALSDGVWEGEMPLLRRDGTPIDVHVRLSPLLDESGSLTGYVGTTIDISARLADARKVREAHDRLRAVTDSMVEGLVTVDADGRLTYMNAAAEGLLGLWSADVLGRCFHDVVHGDRLGTCARSGCQLVRILGDALSERGLETLTRADGSAFPVSFTSSALTTATGPDGLVIVFSDITAAQRAAEALRDSEARFRAVFDRSSNAMFLVDDDERAVEANAAACRLTGLTRDQILAVQHFAFALPPAAAQSGSLRRGARREAWSTTTTGADGTIRELEAEWIPEIVPGRHLAVLRDVTEERRLARQLQQAQKMEAIGQLAGGIAHDFNNLLMVINGYSEAALRGTDDESLRHVLGQIVSAGERAGELTQQLLAFSRQQVMEASPVDLNRVVQDLRTLLERLIGEDIAVVTALADDLGAVIADPGQLTQVVLNLAINARDAMPDGGTLRISTAGSRLAEGQAAPDAAAGDYVSLTVSDSGCGIDGLTAARLFEPFFTTKPAGEGTGLGLATVYGIVKQLDGHITVDSEPGRGAAFTVYLPRAEHAATESTGTSPEPTLARGSERVLVVEDDPIVRELVIAVLDEHGYTAIGASCPEEALARVRDGDPFDLLITDMVMPAINGHELARQIRSLEPGIPIIVMSGYPTTTQGDTTRDDVAFLQKPFTGPILTAKVREVLDHSTTAATA